MRARKIKTKSDHDGVNIEGWFAGRHTYLWLGKDGQYLDTVSDYKLYRLAKAIVKHFENQPL